MTLSESKSLPMVYVAGPYTKGCNQTNVLKAMQLGDLLRVKGCIPFVPHLYFPAWGRWGTTNIAHPHWTEAWEEVMLHCLHWVSVCNFLVLIPGESLGADIEVEHAKSRGIPVVQLCNLNSYLAEVTCGE